MGVPTLWREISAGASTSTLMRLSEDVLKSSNGMEGFKVGVDASLWLHSSGIKMAELDDVGPNPDIRTIFYKTCNLLRSGMIPLIVFDGADRPAWKRGKHTRYRKELSPKENSLTCLLDIMGVSWRQAKGEAEAELAVLAAMGELDAVITDDVDTLLFGAPLVIRNSTYAITQKDKKKQPTPTGDEDEDAEVESSSPGTPAKCDVTLFRARDIERTLALDREALILAALCSGGDYFPSGIPGCGTMSALAIAKTGLGHSLIVGVEKIVSMKRNTVADMELFLADWRMAVAEELRTNAHGFMTSRKPSLAKIVPSLESFPPRRAMMDYLHPSVSTRKIAWVEETLHIPLLVDYCVKFFEWHEEWMLNTLQSRLFPALVMRDLRKAARKSAQSIPLQVKVQHQNMSFSEFPFGTSDLFVNIRDAKESESTEKVFAYRLEIDPSKFRSMLKQALPANDPNQHTINPDRNLHEPSHFHWMSAAFMSYGEGLNDLVKSYQGNLARKEREKREKEERKEMRSRSPTKSPSKSPSKRRSINPIKGQMALEEVIGKYATSSESKDYFGMRDLVDKNQNEVLGASSKTSRSECQGARERGAKASGPSESSFLASLKHATNTVSQRALSENRPISRNPIEANETSKWNFNVMMEQHAADEALRFRNEHSIHSSRPQRPLKITAGGKRIEGAALIDLCSDNEDDVHAVNPYNTTKEARARVVESRGSTAGAWTNQGLRRVLHLEDDGDSEVSDCLIID